MRSFRSALQAGRKLCHQQAVSQFPRSSRGFAGMPQGNFRCIGYPYVIAPAVTTATTSDGDKFERVFPLALAAMFGVGVAVFEPSDAEAQAPAAKTDESASVKGPIYTRADVAKHTTAETGIWVTYKDGVYDITEFVANHPGGAEKIMLAAGKAVDPFWQLYQQHYNSTTPMEMLKQMRIGTLDPSEKLPELPKNDPYASDPTRHPALVFHSTRPCNAESPLTLTIDSWITPTELWFVRHHHPVPDIDSSKFVMSVAQENKEGVPQFKEVKISLKDLKRKFTKHEVTSTIQCGGNRRGGMNATGKKTSGTAWGCGAISTAKWGGVRLKDVLEHCGIDADTEAQHVHFLAVDEMGASIPIEKALNPFGDCLLAYEMNGEPINREHGGPVRAVVPGHVGVRNVKWVHKVVASPEEARGMWNRGLAYKIFTPSVGSVEGLDLEKETSMQEMNVTSAVVSPVEGSLVEGDEVYCTGFAWSGGGRGIANVDVSLDGGATWHRATLKDGADQRPNRAWAWTFWEAELPIPEEAKGKELQICCKATDAASNTQPSDATSIWNIRGLGNNSWHTVKVRVDED